VIKRSLLVYYKSLVMTKKIKNLPDFEVATQRNDLIHGQQSLSLIQKRIFALVVQQINRNDKDYKKYSINIRDLVDTSNSYNVYNQLQEETKKLISKVLTKKETREDGRRSFSHWAMISKAQHIEGEGTLEINLHPDIRDMLLQLKEQGNFTPVPVAEILACRSTHGQRIYEMLYSWRQHGRWEVSLDDLRFSLGLVDKYENYGDFKRFVLEKAQMDLKKNTNMRFTWVEECRGRGRGSGRKVTHLIFEFEFVSDQLDMDLQKKQKKPKKKPPSSSGELAFNLIDRMQKKAELDSEQIEQVCGWLDENPDLVRPFSAYFNRQIEVPVDTGGTDYRGRPIENIQGWAWAKIKKVIENGIPEKTTNSRGY
jgi:plasmid replication initiation protein